MDESEGRTGGAAFNRAVTDLTLLHKYLTKEAVQAKQQ